MKNIIAGILFGMILILTLIQGNVSTEPSWVFISACIMVEVFSLYKYKKGISYSSSITIIIFVFILTWEVLSKYTNFLNPVLCPPPENVFYVFYTHGLMMLEGVFSSLELLIVGFAVSLFLGVVLGLIVGWIEPLKNILHPIVKVLAPIPSVIYTPYIIALMPTFRSASAMVIILGLFFPFFLQMINRVHSMDRQIINTAKSMNVSQSTMLFKVLLPYMIPGVVGSLKISLSTSIMILTLAEMMGATSGMGYFIKNYADFANYTNVIAGIILVGIVVTILNHFVSFLESKTIKWS